MSNSFVAVVAVGLTVFGLAFIATEADIGLGEDQPDERIFFDKDIGQVGNIESDVRNVNLGSFTVGEGRGNIQVYRRDSVEISQGRIFSDPIKFSYNASVPENGSVSFRVLGREGNGDIYIKVNGETVFSEPMTSDFTGTGSEFEIGAEHIDRGVNKFKIGAKRGSWLSPTSYDLENIEVEVNDRDFHERIETFRIFENEFENLNDVELSFRIPSQTSQVESPLEIRVNNNTIREDTLVGNEYTEELTTENSGLNPGRNKIHFLTFGQGFYQIDNAIVDIHYSVTTNQASRSERIELSAADIGFINRENTFTELRYDYTNINDPNRVNITLNDRSYDLRPQNGENQLEIEEDVLKEGDNILTLSGPSSFEIENLRLISSKTD
jgi:hypothetical protein